MNKMLDNNLQKMTKNPASFHMQQRHAHVLIPQLGYPPC